jgi:hypothetical protein
LIRRQANKDLFKAGEQKASGSFSLKDMGLSTGFENYSDGGPFYRTLPIPNALMCRYYRELP